MLFLAGSAVSKLLEQAAANSGDIVLLGEDELDSAGKLELNVTKASIEAALDANCALIVFETDLHIGCPSGQTASNRKVSSKDSSGSWRHIILLQKHIRLTYAYMEEIISIIHHRPIRRQQRKR